MVSTSVTPAMPVGGESDDIGAGGRLWWGATLPRPADPKPWLHRPGDFVL